MRITLTDLFRFVNGPWLDNHVIPEDRANDGIFYQLRDQSEAEVHEIVQASPDSLAGALYSSFMDTEAIEAAGLSPIKEDLDLLEVASIDEFILSLGKLNRTGISAPFGAAVTKDSGSEVSVAYIHQGGLGLPDEAYYREEAHAEVLKLYEDHVATMLAFLLGDAAKEAAQRVVKLESEIAAGHWDVVSSREAVKTFNPMTFDEMPASLAAMLRATGLPDQRTIVMMPSYFEHLDSLLRNERLDDWKLWATWHILSGRASVLTDAISNASFAFYGTVLSGTQVQRDRWKRALGLAESFVGDDIGQLFVEKHFPASSKQEMLTLVDYLIKAYRERISTLTWMTDATRAKALEKLEKFQAKIGYPDTWRDYSSLEFSPNGADLVANVRAGAEYAHAHELGKIGKPNDRSEWLTTPQTINAFYNPTVNDITFPAAILRAPFFNPEADAAENFGAIGAVIGHEIGHGFDDQGSEYDGDGDLQSWWTDEDRAAFKELTAKLVEQFQGLVPTVLRDSAIKTSGVNGAFTLGENIGDLGGLGIAVVAYRMYLADQGLDFETSPILPFVAEDADPELAQHTYNGLQRLFLSWAHIWRGKARPEMAAQLLAIDPHSPPEFRCNVIAGNIAEFYDAFEIAEDSPMYIPAHERVTIW
ncbi:M13 family metallopeptidase [Corynebacterium sp. HS2168-gen11]|uniref:M13 family metallopeptidase n=1 Tax=Corynebacterium sp. HS2168-gen11 TaxID=2974027 RepID=UPI00216AEB96|nr:M13-type metalloendopeptidase [Corynebacterium sp. HS2168-gen11]MCS4535535.1 peptidase M13 [Corynebacterium sp. HS2168-gen11]